MIMHYDQFHAHLARRHITRTQARDAIFATIWYEAPCTVQEVVAILCGKVDQATVYRNIPVFLKHRIIEKVGPSDRYDITDIFKQHRHFFTCRSCTRRIPFNHDALEAGLMQASQQKHFTMGSHRIEIMGTCASCAIGV